MVKEIYLRLFLNTSDKTKASKMSETILNSLVNTKQVSLESYWKDKTLFNLEITQSILNEIPEKIIFEVLGKVSKISTSWNLDMPSDFDLDSFEISGITDNSFKWNFISWGSFLVQERDIPILDVVDDGKKIN